jgi:hypothetical protein
MSKIIGSFACAALAGALFSSGAAYAGPAGLPAKSAISAPSTAQVEEVRYKKRYVARRHYRGYNPGPAIAGAALGLMGAAIAGSMDGGYGGYGYYPYGGYGYGYGYPYPYGYQGW